MDKLKILSYNVNNDYRDIEKKVAIILHMIEEYDVDIIGLQEVTPQFYNYLSSKLNKDKYCISEAVKQSFYNVMISKSNYKSSPSYFSFTNSSMARGYLKLNITHANKNYIVITTHLESGHNNKEIRKLQCDEILASILDVDNCIIFGDMNFTNPEEKIFTFFYLDSSSNDVYTYDSKYNFKAIKPFRNNLDRFYIKTNKKITKDNYYIILFDNIDLSDHFPILLSLFT